jgi:hypothetical protein
MNMDVARFLERVDSSAIDGMSLSGRKADCAVGHSKGDN